MARRTVTGGGRSRARPTQELKTELARRLWAIRQQIIATGCPLLDWDQIEEELAARRGEVTSSLP